jgi:hypothetical protein
MSRRSVLGSGATSVLLALGIVGACQGDDGWRDLFNAVDLDGWVINSGQWAVAGGILVNTGDGANDVLRFAETLPGDAYALEIRVQVVDGMRLRIHADAGMYVGNEGFKRQLDIYGSSASDLSEVSDDSYAPGSWYTLRLEVGRSGKASLYKNGVLTHTARRTAVQPLCLSISAGDPWSPGHVQVSSVRYRDLSGESQPGDTGRSEAPKTIHFCGREWAVHTGANTIELLESGKVLHINGSPTVKSNDYTYVQTPLDCSDSSKWSLSFDVKFGELREAGGGVILTRNESQIALIGADGWHSAISGFIVEDMVHTRPADQEWYSVEFRGDGQSIAMRLNGNPLGSCSVHQAPDSLLVGSRGAGAAGTQTEVMVRNVSFRTGSEGGLIQEFEERSDVLSHWRIEGPESYVTVADGRLRISAGKQAVSTFAGLTPTRNPFEGLADWTLEYAGAYETPGLYGAGIRVIDAKGRWIVMWWQDTSTARPFLGINGGKQWHDSGVSIPHVFTITKQGSTLTAYVNHYTLSRADRWNGFSLAYLKVLDGVHVCDEVSAKQRIVTSGLQRSGGTASAAVSPAAAKLGTAPIVDVVGWDVTCGTNLAVVKGATVHLTGRVEPEDRSTGQIRSLHVRVDKRVIKELKWDQIGMDLDTSEMQPGVHTLDIVPYRTLAHPEQVACERAIAVLERPPYSVSTAPQANEIVSAKLDVTLALRPDRLFHPSRFVYWVDGRPVGEREEPPFGGSVDLRSLAPGPHDLRVTAWDSQRKQEYASEPVRFVVGKRAWFESPADGAAVIVREDKHTLDLKARWPDDLTVTKVEYLCNAYPVGEADAEEGFVHTMDTTDLDPGLYVFTARITCANHDCRYEAAPSKVTVANQPRLDAIREARAAQQARVANMQRRIESLHSDIVRLLQDVEVRYEFTAERRSRALAIWDRATDWAAVSATDWEYLRATLTLDYAESSLAKAENKFVEMAGAKVDLAQSYIALGQTAEARRVLSEVIQAFGSEGPGERAKWLLNTLGKS